MQNLPKIVVRRLLDGASGGDHPDADLLTAFAEQLLPQTERAKVTAHLSRCFECREIVALALPESDALQPTLALPQQRRGWLSWPILRAGFVGAGILAVALFSMVEYRERHADDHVLTAKLDHRGALSSAPTPESAPTPDMTAANQTPAPALSGSQVARLSVLPDGRGEARSGAKPFPRQRKPTESASGMAVSSGQENSKTADASRRPGASQFGSTRQSLAFVPTARGAVNGRAAAVDSLQVRSQSSDHPELSARNQASDQLIQAQKDQASNASQDVVKAKAADASSAASLAPAFASPAAALQTAPAMMRRAFPLWTVSSSGALQRSFDAGKTWEAINPASVAAGQSVPAKKMSDNDSGVRAAFRAVAAIGPEVWVGGNGATLYHSSDSGNQWQRIAFSRAISPNGDVTSIQFSDPQRGSFTTSAGELWTTVDNGQTWQRH